MTTINRMNFCALQCNDCGIKVELLSVALAVIVPGAHSEQLLLRGRAPSVGIVGGIAFETE
jgi:hypothetical protein